MRRTRSTRGVATRAPGNEAGLPAASIYRFFRGKGESLSLAGGIVAIVVGSLAFWLNQPAHLFGGQASSRDEPTSWRAPACDEPSFARGLLSLELASRIARDALTRPRYREAEIAVRCAPQDIAAVAQDRCRPGACIAIR